MPKNQSKPGLKPDSRRIATGQRSLDQMLDLLRPYAPKESGTLAPVTAEWQVVEEEDPCDCGKSTLRHATEPA